MNFDYAARQKKLIGVKSVDAVAIVPGANMEYYTGLRFHLSERPVIAIFTEEGMSIIVPELEVPKLAARPDLEANIVAWTDTEGFDAAFQKAVDMLNLKNGALGVDGQTMRVFEFQAFQQAGAENMRNIGTALLGIRALKAQGEIDAMREAIHLSEQALHRVMEWAKPGMTERQIATKLSNLMAEAGSQGAAFEPLVQSGPNSALPHGMLSDRVLGKDEFLLIDFGGRMHGYPADITRTFCLGMASDEMVKIYDTVLAANLAATKAAGPGVACGDVDKAARDVIEAAGYGEYFIHRTGHGLGIEGHELPQIASGVKTPLEAGNVFTIEPGVYIPGLGGVRIEDNIVVTETGVEVLTQYPRKLTLD